MTVATEAAQALGDGFARALADKRWPDLLVLLSPDVLFKGMTPGRFWEASSPAQLVTDVLQHWFEESDDIEEVIDVAVHPVADRWGIRYELRVRNADGLHLVEQQGYFDVGPDGAVTRMHLMCAGFRPLGA